MQLNEAVAADVANPNHSDECWFCNAKDDPIEEENDLEADPDDDDDGYGAFANNASKLGRALGGDPGEKTVKVDGDSYSVMTAAHHLIPGNAALKKSSLFKSNEYLWVDKKAKGNIGYNVNAAANGVWLPGNYALRPWSSRLEPFKDAYAFRAIGKWGAQFHDAHPDYSDFVLKSLERLYERLEAGETIWCPKAKKNKDKPPSERQPVYAIVARLNTISGRMKKMLLFPTYNWKKNIFTSTRSQRFMDTSEHRMRASR